MRDLSIGMIVADLRAPWWKHEFMRSRVDIVDEQVLAKLQRLGPDHVVLVLPTAKAVGAGTASEPSISQPSNTSAAASTEASSPSNAGGNSPNAAARPRRTTASGGAAKLASLESELDRAKRIVSRARRAIEDAMRAGRTGDIKNLGEIREVAEEMVESTTRNPGALQSLVLLKSADDYTFTHCVAVGAFMISLGRTLGLDSLALKHAGTAGLLHDVGKAGIEDAVLNKPGKLTDDEYASIKLHPQVGEQLLRDAGYEDDASLDVVRHHHERMDGRGYPDGLQSSQISQLARMGAVTDVYDAVTSQRVYHRAISPTAALQMLMKSSKEGHFDSAVVNAFVQTIGLYPNGSLVKLQSGKLAVVKEQAATGNLTAPVVRVFFSLSSNLPIVPYDLRLDQSQDRIVEFAEPSRFGLPREHLTEILGLS
ncbi:HD-GYP domain-containing protein [Paucibacter sp. R3-3]|uniref:HD-GYP domain-containing protein n=1 Tax=Roseateles agri TaxID=3098619 RepID=A0ABU5DHP3_9BURK|nr:HD-GYP domain-containing protein [Paucibacter sp. R3-3]MDY0745674.1 HD-GYP domain-containing protein [Paucibacter sp. R3-3]